MKNKTTDTTRLNLFKKLYQTAWKSTAAIWRNDPDKVKEVRDMYCSMLFHKPYYDLTDAELNEVIVAIATSQAIVEVANKTKQTASPKQIKLLRYYSLLAALHTADFSAITCRFDDGSTATGDELRQKLINIFNEPTNALPRSVIYHLHSAFINPLCHRFLIEGGYKKFIRSPKRFYIYSLTPEEAKYLINRFRSIVSSAEPSVITNEFIHNITSN